ncbi:LysR family transcriptional regulator [Neorhizobium sp. T786]|uniref:LysR family transcriptional regulator n=1 Tax=Pseudorhizobium xiangyangii TaxID=2883104 RepID=UPI001CFFA860|nr:LysR family transcriptional regulator [Neorhizobium xiangyangii]MCB5204591.1 LysR family transcriptional regulator [Neorhizobium xiangyangii]
MRVDYLGLEAFVAVAELGSFSKAARKLNLTQTALSHRVRKIETDLNTRLLVRTSREISLTKAGQLLLPQVRDQLANLAELYEATRGTGHEARRCMVFACLPTIASYYLPHLMKTFSDCHRGFQVVLLDQPAGRIMDLVKEGEAEFGITIIGATPWDLEVESLCREPYVLLVNRQHRLAEQTSVTREDLLGEPMVRIRTQSTNRQLVENSLGDVSRQLDWRFEVQNAATAMSLVASGVALTVLPRLTMHQSPANIVGLPFADVDLSRNIGAIRRRGSPLSPPAEALLELIRNRLMHI